MKHIILFCSLLISFTSLMGQGYNKSVYYFGDSTNTLNTIQASIRVGSNVYMAVDIVDSMQDQRLTLVKININGNLIKKVLLGDTSYLLGTYPGHTIIMDNDSNIIICDLKIGYSSGNYDGYIAKFDKDLNLLWTKTYDLPYNLAGCSAGQNPLNYFTAIRLCADGNYILSANYDKNCVTNNFGCYLQKIDTAGNVIWTQAYTNIQSCFDFEIAPDSGFFIAAPKNDVFYVTKTDQNGVQQWNKRVNSNQHHRVPEEIENFDASHIIVASAYLYDVSGQYAALNVCKLNTQTKVIDWEKNFMIHKDFIAPTLNQYIKMFVLPDKSIIIAATAMVTNWDTTKAGYKGILLKLNQNGDSLWSRYYGVNDFSDYSAFCDMMLMDDGGFLAVGYNDNHVEHLACSAWLVRTDSLGYAPGCGTVGVESGKLKVKSLKIFPNPAKEYFTIEYKLPVEILEGAIIEIISADGKVVKSIQLDKPQYQIIVSTDELSSGIYLCTLKNKGAVVETSTISIMNK